MNDKFMIDPTKVTDNMKPPEFRFNKRLPFEEYFLPLTKNDEQYILAKQLYEHKATAPDYIHYTALYYIIDCTFQVIGRFDVGQNPNLCGISYHIIEGFQNRGIGQIVLRYIVDELFKHNQQRIVIFPTNERSATIATKIGFTPKSKRAYELRLLDYQKMQESDKKFN